MNSVQFGRWLSERRRACGWPSQRLFAKAAQQHALLHSAGISEDFLARLEAGHLVYPFRGMARRRVFQLAWLLCKTPRDLKAYLKAAGLSDFSDEESSQLHRLSEHLATLQTPPPLLLPPRPQRLKGRETELARIMHALSEPETRVFSLTGMPGVGKSALACEALHQLASAESERLRRFPDGIATFACTGRQGTRGLLSLLAEVTALFTPAEQSGTRGHNLLKIDNLHTEQFEDEAELAAVMDRTRAALVHRRALLLLDDLDPAFPLRQALDVLLASGSSTAQDPQAEQVIMLTSQFIPAPVLISDRLHLPPLNENTALELLADLIGEELSAVDQVYARSACSALGYLPLAIESMATAILAKGIPLALVATHLAAQPLEGLLDSEKDITAKLEKALAALDQELRSHYLLLAALDLPVFNLAAAAAVFAPYKLPLCEPEQRKKTSTLQIWPVAISQRGLRVHAPPDFITETPDSTRQHKRATWEMAYREHMPDLAGNTQIEEEKARMATLASAAAVLGQLVRYSLLELLPAEQENGDTHNRETSSNEVGYCMHALLRIYARKMAQTLPEERLELARHNLLSYALTYLTHHEENISNVTRAAGRRVVLSAIELAWSEQRYEVVMRLVQGLISLSERLEGDEGEIIVQKGLYASQQIQNQTAIISFLDRLASLRCYRGDLETARQMWEAALRIQESMDTPPGYWRPLIGLAHLARMQGDFMTARRFSEAYAQRAEGSGVEEF